MAKRIEGQWERIIARERYGDYREYRIPGILPTPNGLLLVCEGRCGEGEEKLGDWGDIDILVLRIESDGEAREVLRIGESSQLPNGTMRTHNNPVLIPDGERVHLIYHRNYREVFMVTSEDEGKTWSCAREITETYRRFDYPWTVSATGPGHGIRMKTGRLVVPIWVANGKERENGTREHKPAVAGCIYSDDHGITWQTGHLVQGVISANETAVVELSDGKLLFCYRNRNPEFRRVIGISSDGGETLERQFVSDELRDPRCFAGLDACADGILFVNCDSEEKRTNLTVKFSSDEGNTWESIWEVDKMGGYADIAVVGEEIYLFYERTGYEPRSVRELVLKKGKLISESQSE